MKKIERIEALEIAENHEIKVTATWWSPFSNVAWEVLKSKKKLSYEQYYYLSNNKLLKPVCETIKNEEIILTISDIGKDKLLSLKSGGKL